MVFSENHQKHLFFFSSAFSGFRVKEKLKSRKMAKIPLGSDFKEVFTPIFKNPSGDLLPKNSKTSPQ